MTLLINAGKAEVLFAFLINICYTNILSKNIFILLTGVIITDIRPDDILIMKKKHPCGEKKMLVLRSGMDFKLRCIGCGREFMIARSKAEKNIKSVIRDEDT